MTSDTTPMPAHQVSCSFCGVEDADLSRYDAFVLGAALAGAVAASGPLTPFTAVVDAIGLAICERHRSAYADAQVRMLHAFLAMVKALDALKAQQGTEEG